ncbi:MAG: ATP-binding protein [Planctomycetota bacterium]
MGEAEVPPAGEGGDRRAAGLVHRQRDLALALNERATLDELLPLCLAAALEMSGTNAGGIYIVDPETGAVELVHHTGLSPAFVAANRRYDPDHPKARFVQAGRPFYSAAGVPEFLSDVVGGAEGIRAFGAVPVLHGGRPIACLNVASTAVTVLPADAPALLETIAGQIGGALARARAEQALREREEELRRAQEVARIGSWHLDLVRDELRWSVETYRMFGVPPGQRLTLEDFDALVHPADGGRVERAWEAALRGAPYDIEHRIVVRGEVRWVRERAEVDFDAAGRAIRATGTVQDVTDRKEAELALARSEARTRALLDAVPDVMFVVSADGIVRSYKSSPEDALARREAEVVGRPLGEALPAPLAESALRAMRGALATGQVGKAEVFRAGRPPAGDFEVRAVAIGPGEVMLLLRDITETRRLRELESRAQRLETAGSVAGQVAHDFNNLLAPLTAYPDLIRDGLPADHPVLHYVESMETAAWQLAELNQQLLTLGRRGHYDQVPLNLNPIVERVVRELGPPAGAVTVETRLDPALLNILGGSAQIHRVVANLLHNALDALPGPGVVTLQTENLYVDEPTGSYARVPVGEYVRLRVTDTGCGIPDDVLGRIFEPFFTTKTVGRKQGSGLGLSVVAGVVKDHRGYIDLATRVGEGTTFLVYFPVTRAAAGEAPPEEVEGGTESVLVVDDDPVQREVSLEILRRLGYRAEAVASGEEAIAALEREPRDLLVLDMVLAGGMDGAETYRRVLARVPGQRAILVSGYSATDRVREAQRLGAGAFVPKPLTVGALARAVRAELRAAACGARA